MATAAENERLGVLESEVAHIKSDVAEIKSDVKSLINAQQSVAIDLAARQAADAAIRANKASTNLWLKFFAERGMALAALVVSLFTVVAHLVVK